MKVTMVRVSVERHGKGFKWHSERRLRSEGYTIENHGETFSLPKTLVPDGIMLNSKGERVAVELEASIRRRSRFQFKIEEYARVMAQDHFRVVEKVLFIVTNKTLYNELKRLTDRKPGFLVDYYQNYLESLVTPKARVTVATPKTSRGSDSSKSEVSDVE